jgi:AraC-like DNA-binding protein
MRLQRADHRYFALFPPYAEVEPVSHPTDLPSEPLPPRGAALIWNLYMGDWGSGSREVRHRPAGVALFILLPPATKMDEADGLLALMEACRPHSILPHMEELNPQELVAYLRRFPADLPLEVTDFLAWRGIEFDTDTRRLIRKTLELSGELRTVSGLARSLYMSRRALGRRFTTRGLPVPSHWLHFGRILRASIRLQNPDSTLYSVACELGYPDGFSLSNQMSRITGLRPSLMRECFGWEWIVEAWIREEAVAGNLSPTLRNRLLPMEGGMSLQGRRTLGATGTTPVQGQRVAERAPSIGRARGSS